MTVKSFIVLLLTASFLYLPLAAEAQVKGRAPWTLDQNSLLMTVFSDPFDSVNTRTFILALSYKKSESGDCLPVLALLTFQSTQLGTFQSRRIFSGQRDRMLANVDGKDFFAQGDTVINLYDNGMEVVSYFAPELANSILDPSVILLSAGSFGQIANFTSTNNIGENSALLIRRCEANQ